MNWPKQVYAIQHNRTKKIYIGSSKDALKRYMNHICQLRAGNHPVGDMQADFNSYGEDYSLFILEDNMVHAERQKEYEWMRRYKTFDRRFGYNYREKERRTLFQETPPLQKGTPKMLEVDFAERNEWEDYLCSIHKRLKRCDDISFLAFIEDLLIKNENAV